ncbi:MAG: SDR family oxidoreductase [Candidatus Aminicenantes bacterium]|uniref:UDP-glucose 4-epimerase n=1 Tax=Candidatus Saccharicenans subterraneus TaxID=2508984 RepID=A0A3E2BLB4_9BACT|nr:SDR family oxidoreductase [Candidatus Aminicenantes bacterium]RFT15549.1 MAG: UDP-glucose 4-epimerase [Candidatus Saccharicenans subterraneum]
MLKYSRYLVTGGAGFIGSHLVERLASLGCQVRVLDDFSTGKEENLSHLAGRVEIIRGDIRDRELCQKAAEGMEVVLHQAALASVPRSVSEPLLAHEINLTGTLNLLLAAAEQGIRSFVFASSSAVYGDDQTFPKKEGLEGKALSPYGAQKLASEKYCQVFSQLYNFNAVSLRYFNVFGPRQDPGSQYAAVVPIFITRMLRGQPPIIYGDGHQSRDFIYVENVVQANLLAANATDFRGEVFNIGTASRITVKELAAILNSLLGVKMSPVYADPRPGDIMESYADISRAEHHLGFRPEVDFEKGLKLTIDWYKSRMG